jgi:hypothetical protein
MVTLHGVVFGVVYYAVAKTGIFVMDVYMRM